MTLGLAVAVGFILFLLAIAFIMATRKSNMIDKKRKRLFKQQQFRQKHVQMYLKDKNKDADKNDGNGMKMKEESFENPSPTIFNVLPKYSTEFAMKQFNPNEINLSRPLSHLEMERKKIEEIHRTIEGNESESTSSSQLPMNHSDQYNYYESNSNNNNNNNRQYDYSTQHRNKEEVLMIDVKEKDQSIRKTVRFNPSSPNMQLTRMHETQKWLQTNSSSSDEGCYGSSELSAVTQQQLKLHNNQIKRQSYDTVSDSITAEKEIIVPQRNNYDSSWSDSRNGKKCLMKNENENNHKIDYQLHKAQPVQLRWTKSLKEGEENHEEINNYGICRSKTLTQYSETNSSTSSNLSASNILTTGIVNASFRNFERLYHKTDSINNLINNEIADDSPNSLIVNADNNCLELTPKLLPRASFV
ncbi:hypothetical protein SNEBB_010009 [Seison nebaliae]|nr:hypothetical protein SNEBB_010009 [Seison nebaliae]